MNYKIGICDDFEEDRSLVLSYTKEWAEKNGNDVKINAFSSAKEFLFNYEDEKDYDILLLDVEMGKTNGVEFAKTLRKDDELDFYSDNRQKSRLFHGR